MNKKIMETSCMEDTAKFAYEMAQNAEPGQVYALIGDLGVGKTVFTKGFAEGLGIEEPVSSPTFTILQIYEEGRLPLYHFDVYRIEEPEEMEEVGFDDYIYISTGMESALLSGLTGSRRSCRRRRSI